MAQMELATDSADIISKCGAHFRSSVAQIGDQLLPWAWYVSTISDRMLNRREPLP